MADGITTPAPSQAPEAAPVSVSPPTEPKAYDQWRMTGKVEQPKAAPAPAKKSSDAKPVDAGDDEGTGERQDAPESEPGKKQEHQPSKAERRLNELLEDLRRAGLSPSELKSFKREAKAAAAEEKPKPAEPATDEAPKKPKADDFNTYEEYEEARDKYLEDLTDYKARKAVESDRMAQRRDAAQKEMTERLNQAKQRYGDGADQKIVETAKAIFQDQSVPGVIREVLNESDVLVDVMYALGKDASELDDFIELTKTNPGQALRKAVLIEKLVKEELGKGSAAAGDGPVRDESGKFVSSKPPEKKTTGAPPPPRETSGRSGPPADPVERAAETGDFQAFRDAANRRDIAKRQGR